MLRHCLLALALCLMVALPARAANTAARLLNIKMPATNFANVPLGDCIDFVRDASGANIVVDWKNLATVNITKDTLINLRLRDTPLRKVLDLVLSEAGEGSLLTYFIDENVIEITTRAEADRHMYTIVYDVHDLLITIPNFNNAPQFNLQSQSNTGSSSGTAMPGQVNSSSSSGGGLFSGGTTSQNNPSSGGPGSANDPTTLNANNLVKLIEDTIRPDIWRENGGTSSIRYFNGLLIVTAPRSVLEAIGGPINN